jgi:hypothetical protein
MGFMKLFIVQFLVLVVLFLSFSCNTEVTYPDSALGLALKDFSCTEAWIEVQIGANDKTANIYIKKNDEIIKTFKLGQSDSLFYFDDLQPNTAYRFDAVTYDDGKEIKSNPVTFTTLDTTSHNFSWQTFVFGQHSSSTLYDVAIINENDIWAVGEIYMNDSLGNLDPPCYNAVHWDGQNWKLNKIYHGSYCNPVDYPPFKSIIAFSDTDIVLTSGGSIGFFDGVTNRTDCSITPILSGTINKMWGSSSNDFYIVGNNGSIAHYQNRGWTKLETDIDIDFRDIYGSVNEESDELEIIALASNSGLNQSKKIVRIKDHTVETLPDSGLVDYLSTIWFMSGRKYCIGGQGYYESRTFGPVWERNNTIPPFHITSIRGAGLNDIVLGGSFGLLMHYNGVSWMNYAYITASYFDVISEVAIKDNTIVAAGFKGSKAVVLIGKRN